MVMYWCQVEMMRTIVFVDSIVQNKCQSKCNIRLCFGVELVSNFAVMEKSELLTQSNMQTT